MNESRIERICQQYNGKVTAYVKSRVANPYTVEDLVSSVFLKICQSVDSFDDRRASLSTWIYTLTRNTVIDHLRRQREYCELDEALEGDSVGVEEQVLSMELLEHLAIALEQLKERERDLINLHYYQQCSLKEVACAMGISYSGAKLIHQRALKKLKLHLQKKI